MADDILAFIEKWIEDNVAPVEANLIPERAESLAEQCYREAADAGFDESEIEEAVAELADGEDLASYIEAALEKAEEDEEADEDD